MSATDNTDDTFEVMVSTAWEASYANPLAGHAGERVEATDRVEDWHETPGWSWRWCRDSHGREGWVPDVLLEVNGTEATLREDYDARELTVAVDVRLIVKRELAGWAFCQTSDGASGWVPLECLTRLSD